MNQEMQTRDACMVKSFRLSLLKIRASMSLSRDSHFVTCLEVSDLFITCNYIRTNEKTVKNILDRGTHEFT